MRGDTCGSCAPKETFHGFAASLQQDRGACLALWVGEAGEAEGLSQWVSPGARLAWYPISEHPNHPLLQRETQETPAEGNYGITCPQRQFPPNPH